MYKLCQIIFEDNISAEMCISESTSNFHLPYVVIIVQTFLRHVDLSALLKDLRPGYTVQHCTQYCAQQFFYSAWLHGRNISCNITRNI